MSPCPNRVWNHTSGCACTANGSVTAEVDVDLDGVPTLYHGSPVLLGPGEALLPGTAASSPYGRDEPHVFLTDSVGSATQWALDANEMRGIDAPVYVYEIDAPAARPQPHEDDTGQHVTPTATVRRRVR